jgi:hypothetical protein
LASGRIVRMSFALEFDDSEVRDVVANGGAVRLRFSAAAGRNEAGERGWLTSVQLEFSAATLNGDATHAFGRIAQGRLRHGRHGVAPLAVPGSLAGALELALRLANGSQVVVRGHALVASVDDGARFTPDLSC